MHKHTTSNFILLAPRILWYVNTDVPTNAPFYYVGEQ
jgi:hypothetical protein